MQANWSLILNSLLLVGVIVAIGSMMRERRKNNHSVPQQPSVGQTDKARHDDIIAVRKINREEADASPVIPQVKQPAIRPAIVSTNVLPTIPPQENVKPMLDSSEGTAHVMIFLLAKENRQLAGYELLQTLLSSGMRFGEGHLFHRHQFANGQGPVLCSLAAATPSGVFDLQNIGAFSVRGLCLFMQPSGNSTIDAERFEIMLETAKQLRDGLDAHLLDDQRRPLTDVSLQRYYQQLSIADAVTALLFTS